MKIISVADRPLEGWGSLRTSPVLALPLILLTAGCAGDADPSLGSQWSVDTLQSGAVLVQNQDGGLWAEGEGWRLVEELRIGAVDGAGAEVFGDVHALSLAVSEDGRIYVLDGQAGEVRVFDGSGAHVGSFGRSGAGPGELRSPFIAGWGPKGNLWIADAANARYTVFTPQGELVTTHRRESTFSMRPWPGTIDTAGRVLDVGVRFSRERVRGPGERVVVRVDPPSGAMDTFPLPHDERGSFVIRNAAGLPVRSVGVPYAGHLVWRLDPRGYVWSAITDQYRIVQQELSGDTVRTIELQRSPTAVTAEERARAFEGFEDFVAAGGRLDPSRIPATKPFLSDFMVDDRGYVWAVPSHRRKRVYDVFDADGRYLGEVPTPVFLVTWTARPVFRGEHVYGFVLDEMMVPYFVRLRIENRAPLGSG